jgi:predicted Zn-dependent peptidase
MPTTVFRFLFLAMALFTTATALAAPQRMSQPNPNDPMKTEIYKLDNGLLVYLTENHESPRFYAEIATRAGSKMDPAESTGLAHYLEHMLFKGTDKLGSIGYDQEKPFLDEVEALYEQHFKETDPEKRKELYRKINEASAAAAQFAVPNEIDRLYKSMGATDVNAHTWHEETVYKVDLPANRIEQWATIESERFRKPVLRLFPTELEAVYEEMNRALDNKQRIITYAVDGLLYKKHPYGQQPTLGVVEHLKNPSLTNINRYYETYYVPNNMAIFISGDINTAETLALIDRYFGAWQPKDVPPVGTWEEAPINGREFVETTYRGEEYVLLAFRTASNKSADAEALIVLDMMLDNATAGLINLNLNQKQVVRQAGSYPQQYNDYGAQYLYGIPKEGQTLEEVEKLLLGQLDILKRGEIEDWVIPAIVNDFKKNKKAGLEDDTARVSAMRSSWIDLNDWDHAVAQIERIEKVTKEDVVRVANQYFGANYVCGYRRDAAPALPKVEKPEITKVDIDPSRLSDFGKAVMAMPVKEIEPVFIDPAKDYTIAKVQKGVELYYVPNPINDIFSLTFSIEFGNHQDNTINTAAGLLQKSGTENFSAEELKKEWYKLGTEFGIGAGDNETTITLTGLDENFEASVALLMELLAAPKVDDAPCSRR